MPKKSPLPLEQFIGLELLKYIHAEPEKQVSLHFWRDANGIEVDYVLCRQEKIIPIEIKWTSSIRDTDTKHLRLFLKDYPEVEHAFLIAPVEHPLLINNNIMVLPWMMLRRAWEAIS